MAVPVQTTVDTPTGPVSYSARGDGPVRLVLHSLLTDRTAFDGVRDAMGGRVIAMDLPGFGATEPAEPDIDDYAERVAALIETLESEHGELTLIGNGLGAFAALGTAIHHGPLVGRLLLVGCGAAFPEPAKEAFTKMIELVETGGMEAMIPVALRRIFTEPYLEANPGMADERAAILGGTDPKAFVTACEALRRLDYTDLAPKVTAPTLIVVGEEDQATPPPMAEELHRLIEGSTLIQLSGVAHAPQIQNPGAFIEATRAFVEAR